MKVVSLLDSATKMLITRGVGVGTRVVASRLDRDLLLQAVTVRRVHPTRCPGILHGGGGSNPHSGGLLHISTERP